MILVSEDRKDGDFAHLAKRFGPVNGFRITDLRIVVSEERPC